MSLLCLSSLDPEYCVHELTNRMMCTPQEGMREKLAREKAAGEEDKGKTHAIDSPNDASSEDSNDSNRFQKGTKVIQKLLKYSRRPGPERHGPSREGMASSLILLCHASKASASGCVGSGAAANVDSFSKQMARH